MVRLSWGSKEQRVYEAGLDRGVLQVEGSKVVPWSGLTSFTESPKGGDLKPVYQDGIRIYNHAMIKEFSGTLEAISYPEEFMECEGFYPIETALGLIADQQPSKNFNLSYRTGRGNGVDEIGKNYKLHFIYNCSVTPSSKTYKTISDSVDLTSYSWEIETFPMLDIADLVPAAHFSIDSSKVQPDKLKAIEDILYGTHTNDPEFLNPLKIKNILSERYAWD